MNGTDPGTAAKVQARIRELVIQRFLPGEPFFMASPEDIAKEIEREFPTISKGSLQQAAYDLQAQSDKQGGFIPGTPVGQVAGFIGGVGDTLGQIQQLPQKIQQAAQDAAGSLFGHPDWSKIAVIGLGLVLIVWGASIYAAPATEELEQHSEAVVRGGA